MLLKLCPLLVTPALNQQCKSGLQDSLGRLGGCIIKFDTFVFYFTSQLMSTSVLKAKKIFQYTWLFVYMITSPEKIGATNKSRVNPSPSPHKVSPRGHWSWVRDSKFPSPALITFTLEKNFTVWCHCIFTVCIWPLSRPSCPTADFTVCLPLPAVCLLSCIGISTIAFPKVTAFSFDEVAWDPFIWQCIHWWIDYKICFSDTVDFDYVTNHNSVSQAIPQILWRLTKPSISIAKHWSLIADWQCSIAFRR